MKTCEICNEKKGDRIIAGMSICNNCFARLQGLRNGNEDDLPFFIPASTVFQGVFKCPTL